MDFFLDFFNDFFVDYFFFAFRIFRGENIKYISAEFFRKFFMRILLNLVLFIYFRKLNALILRFDLQADKSISRFYVKIHVHSLAIIFLQFYKIRLLLIIRFLIDSYEPRFYQMGVNKGFVLQI